jgi:hypothetical protein
MEYNLGKLYGIEIFVKLEEKDEIQKIDLNELPSHIKNDITKIEKNLKQNPMNKWLNKSKFYIDREEYYRLINLNDSILKNRSIDNRKYFYYFLQSYTMEELKQICRDHEVKGYSKFKKDELIEFIKDSLSEEEIFEFLEEREVGIISREFAIALSIINNKHKEKIEKVKIVNPDKHEIEISYTAFNWDSSNMVSINDTNIKDCERDCDCIIGRDGGFCCHFFIGFIKSFQLGYFKLSNWKLTALPYNVENLIKDVKIKSLI